MIVCAFGHLGQVPPKLGLQTCDIPSACRIGVLDLDFGDLLKYNIFTYGNFTNDESNPSDVQGRVAVGGNHSVPLGHTIGDQLCSGLLSEGTGIPPDFNGSTCDKLEEVCCIGYDSNNLIVRGSSRWPGGRLYFGGACVGDLNISQFGQWAIETGQSAISENVLPWKD